jgi:hypothetical protein
MWILPKEGAPRKLAAVDYARPFVTSDGRWLAAAKSPKRGWANPNVVVRFDLQALKEYEVDVPAADNFQPVAWIAARGKFLLYRRRDDPESIGDRTPMGPEEAEYRLLDPESGETAVVRGEFGPFHDQTWRPLQAAGAPGTFWAALPAGGDSTVVGLFDAGAFRFEARGLFPKARFDSMDLWVPEGGKEVLVAVRGDVLVLPLK